jgi:NADH-quinone oxidoreductase subunit N
MVLALLTTVVGLYVYFRVAAVMFMGEAEDDVAFTVPTASKVVLAVATIATVLLGLLPWPLLEVAGDALPL